MLQLSYKITFIYFFRYSSFPGISYRIANPSRYDEIQNLLYDNFHVDEPMSSVLKMYDGINRSPILNQFAIDGLSENMSIMAIDEETNKLLGVSINQTAQPSNLDPETELQGYLKAYDDPKFGHILRVLHGVNQNAGDLFKTFDMIPLPVNLEFVFQISHPLDIIVAQQSLSPVDIASLAFPWWP